MGSSARHSNGNALVVQTTTTTNGHTKVREVKFNLPAEFKKGENMARIVRLSKGTAFFPKVPVRNFCSEQFIDYLNESTTNFRKIPGYMPDTPVEDILASLFYDTKFSVVFVGFAGRHSWKDQGSCGIPGQLWLCPIYSRTSKNGTIFTTQDSPFPDTPCVIWSLAEKQTLLNYERYVKEVADVLTPSKKKRKNAKSGSVSRTVGSKRSLSETPQEKKKARLVRTDRFGYDIDDPFVVHEEIGSEDELRGRSAFGFVRERQEEDWGDDSMSEGEPGSDEGVESEQEGDILDSHGVGTISDSDDESSGEDSLLDDAFPRIKRTYEERIERAYPNERKAKVLLLKYTAALVDAGMDEDEAREEVESTRKKCKARKEALDEIRAQLSQESGDSDEEFEESFRKIMSDEDDEDSGVQASKKQNDDQLNMVINLDDDDEASERESDIYRNFNTADNCKENVVKTLSGITGDLTSLEARLSMATIKCRFVEPVAADDLKKQCHTLSCVIAFIEDLTMRLDGDFDFNGTHTSTREDATDGRSPSEDSSVSDSIVKESSAEESSTTSRLNALAADESSSNDSSAEESSAEDSSADNAIVDKLESEGHKDAE